MHVLLAAFLASFLLSLILVRLRRYHSRLTADDTHGVQKFHHGDVPRIGGVGVIAGIVAAWAVLSFRVGGDSPLFGSLLVASLPAFGAGLTEDLTRRIGPLPRLLATMVAAALAAWWAGGILHRLDLPGIDALMAWTLPAWAFTIFAVAGVAHAVNIIDGFNGLASMVVVLMLGAVAYVAFLLEDQLVWNMCLAGIGSLLGFWLWNWPYGLIFLGDGGAYWAGFWFAEAAVLLTARNPQVSPWFGLLVGMYPVFETIFSMYRRRILRRRSAGLPDALHLHSLLFRRMMRWAAGKHASRDLTRRNAATSPYLWAMAMISIIPAVLLWRSTPLLIVSVCGFVLIYIWAYRSIVRFRTRRLRPWRGRP